MLVGVILLGVLYTICYGTGINYPALKGQA